MRLLLVYPWKHHHRMIETLQSLLEENGLTVDVFCIDDYSYTSRTNTFCFRVYKTFYKTIRHIPSSRVRTKIYPIFKKWIWPLYFKSYDLVEFHANIYEYDPFIKGCEKYRIPFDIILWGSDTLRATKEDFVRKEHVFRNCRKIIGIQKLLQVISKEYDSRYDDKFHVAHFGNSNFPVIDRISEKTISEWAQKLAISREDKMTVVCGYNRMSTQQHFIMLEALNALNKELKSKILVVLQMNYGCKEPQYIRKVKEYMVGIGIEYTILEDFLSAEPLAALRLAGDIVINAQTTDALCSSLPDSLYCEKIVMIADWLDYPEFDENGVFYIKYSKNNLKEKIEDVLTNYTEYKKKAEGNKERIYHVSSWNNTKLEWYKAYMEK